VSTRCPALAILEALVRILRAGNPDHANSEYVSYAGVDQKGAKFIGNRQTNIRI